MTNYLVAKLETESDILASFGENYFVMEFDEKLCKHYLEISNAIADVASRIDKNISGLRLRIDYCVPQLKTEDLEIFARLDEMLKENNGYAITHSQSGITHETSPGHTG